METAVTEKQGTTGFEYLKIAAGSVVVLGGSALLIRYFIKKGLENTEENKSLDEGSAATYAKKLNMAFKNNGYFGTNTKDVRQVFQEIPTKEVFEQVEKSYQKQFATPLAKDLADELTSSQYNEMIAIKAAKPDKAKISKAQKTKVEANKRIQWAKRFKLSFESTFGPFSATDVEALKAILYEIPTQHMFADVAAIYKLLYHTVLMEDIKSALHFWQFNEYLGIIKSKALK